MFSLHPSQDITLLIHVGNGTLSAGLVVFSPSLEPHLVYSTYTTFSTANDPYSEKFLTSFRVLCDEAFGQIATKGTTSHYFKKSKARITQVHISFAAPWYVSASKDVHIEQKKDFIITPSFVADVIAKEKILFEKEIQSHTEDGESLPEPFVSTEGEVVTYRINGYELKDVFHKKTKIFDVSLYVSAIQQSILATVEDSLHSVMHISKNQIVPHTFLFASWNVVREKFPEARDFLLITVAHEITEITWVSHKNTTHTVSFRFGRNSLLRHISKVFAVTEEISESFLHLYTSEKMDTDMMQRMHEVMTDIQKEWAVYIEDAVTRLSAELILPSSVYLIAPEDTAVLFADFLTVTVPENSLQNSAHLEAWKKNITITHIGENILSSAYIHEPNAHSDTFLALLIVFCSHLSFANHTQ